MRYIEGVLAKSSTPLRTWETPRGYKDASTAASFFVSAVLPLVMAGRPRRLLGYAFERGRSCLHMSFEPLVGGLLKNHPKAVKMQTLSLQNQSVRTLDNLFCLQDIHAASNSDKNKQPAFFIRNQQTKDLIQTIHSANSQSAVRIVNGGPDRGTWACQELVIAYANWISPKFYLHVINTFLANQGQSTLPSDYTQWRDDKAMSVALGFIPAIKDELDNQYKSMSGQGHSIAFNFVKSELACKFSILTKHAIDSLGIFCDQIKLTNDKVQKVARG